MTDEQRAAAKAVEARKTARQAEIDAEYDAAQAEWLKAQQKRKDDMEASNASYLNELAKIFGWE